MLSFVQRFTQQNLTGKTINAHRSNVDVFRIQWSKYSDLMKYEKSYKIGFFVYLKTILHSRRKIILIQLWRIKFWTFEGINCN